MKFICFFYVFFYTHFVSFIWIAVDFSDLSPEELRILHTLVPPTLLTIDGDICGDYALYQTYRSQVERTILEHRAENKKREELEKRAQERELQEFGVLLAETPLEEWGVRIPHPLSVLEAYVPLFSASSCSSSLSLPVPVSDDSRVNSRKRPREFSENSSQKKQRDLLKPTPLRIEEKHKRFLETLLRNLHKNQRNASQS